MKELETERRTIDALQAENERLSADLQTYKQSFAAYKADADAALARLAAMEGPCRYGCQCSKHFAAGASPVEPAKAVNHSEQQRDRVQTQREEVQSDAYDQIDRYLRNSMDDVDYEIYSKALDVLAEGCTKAAQPSEDLLQDVAAYIGVGGYNGAIPQQLADRIRAEFDRLHQPVIPLQDEIEKLAHQRCKRYVHLDDTPYRFNGHTLMHFVMGITDVLTRKETNEQ